MSDTTPVVNALEVQELSWHFGVRPILDRVSFALPIGAKVGLLGANGSGKSSLLKCLLGLQNFDSGEVTLCGHPLSQLDDEVRAKLAYVSQSPDLFPWMSVEQHLRTIGQAYPLWNEKRAIELALSLELSLGKTVSKLSGGDQQKLAIVLALAHQPELIVMDEPVANLDALRRHNLMRHLFLDHRWISPQATLIITSHFLSDLDDVLSHVIFMREGQIQLYADWRALRQTHCVIANQLLQGVRPEILHQGHETSVVAIASLPTHLQQGQGSGSKSITLDTLFAALHQ